ncbi:transporter substrate-binding domain-containing protein [Sulfurimonas sp.]|nr:transporter substrate-binding domain-containing protein [Sulfurimonas sp.]
MKNLFIKSAALTLAISTSLFASGPRVTTNVFQPLDNEIVSLDIEPLYSNNTPSGGMIFEIVKTALDTEGEKVTLTTYPVKKMINYYITQENTLAALGINWNLSKNSNKSIISIPVALIRENYIYYKPSHPNGIPYSENISTLKGMTYGAHSGENVEKYNKSDIKVVRAESRFLFKKLISKKVDFIKEPVLSASFMINSSFASNKDNLVLIDSKPQKSICSILFNLKNKNGKEISKKFRKGLLHIIKNGKYQNIIEKYQGKTNYTSQYIEELKSLLK